MTGGEFLPGRLLVGAAPVLFFADIDFVNMTFESLDPRFPRFTEDDVIVIVTLIAFHQPNRDFGERDANRRPDQSFVESGLDDC